MKVVSLKESDNHSGMASPHVTGERQGIGQRGDNEKTRTGEREIAVVEPEEAALNTEVQSAENIQIEEDGQIKATRVRKRTRNEENWTRNIRKRLKNSGKAYTTSRGKQVAGKELKAPCTENVLSNALQNSTKLKDSPFSKNSGPMVIKESRTTFC